MGVMLCNHNACIVEVLSLTEALTGDYRCGPHNTSI